MDVQQAIGPLRERFAEVQLRVTHKLLTVSVGVQSKDHRAAERVCAWLTEHFTRTPFQREPFQFIGHLAVGAVWAFVIFFPLGLIAGWLD